MSRTASISMWNRQPALLLALAALLFHLPVLISGGYGIFRDELYYIACANHLAFGYVDQPPFSIFVLAIWKGIFGDSLFSIRLLGTLVGVGSVYTGVRIAALLGGRWFAQLFTGFALIFAPQLMALRSTFSMNVFDLFLWNLVIRQFLILSRTGERRMWVQVGVLLGLTLLNKISGLWLGAGIFIGMLATPLRRDLRTRWPWLGAGIAILLFMPYVIWQMTHGWATLEFIRNAALYKNAPLGVFGFLKAQFLNMSPVLTPFWIVGMIVMLLKLEFRPVRAAAFIFPVVLLILLISGSAKPYYLAPAFTLPIAAGAIALEWWFSRNRSSRIMQTAVLAVVLISGVLLAPLAIPILPVDSFIKYQQKLGVAPADMERNRVGILHQFFADMQGWQDLANRVAEMYIQLPETDRDSVLIFAQNYGEAAAVDYFGEELGLPPASCGHNNYWLWGPKPENPSVFLVIGDDIGDLREIFEEVELGTVHTSRYAMPYEANLPVWVCREPRVGTAEIWNSVRHYE